MMLMSKSLDQGHSFTFTINVHLPWQDWPLHKKKILAKESWVPGPFHAGCGCVEIWDLTSFYLNVIKYTAYSYIWVFMFILFVSFKIISICAYRSSVGWSHWGSTTNTSLKWASCVQTRGHMTRRGSSGDPWAMIEAEISVVAYDD